MSAPRTLFDKIWASHVVDESSDGMCLIYIDRHLVHEVTSPQAFEGLRNTGRRCIRLRERLLLLITMCQQPIGLLVLLMTNRAFRSKPSMRMQQNSKSLILV